MQTDATPVASSGNGGSKWPVCAMLSYGTFGRQTAAGRRYHFRTALALAAMVVFVPGAAILAKHFPHTLWSAVEALVLGAGFFYIAWEFRRYLLSLDELARGIQFEAMAWTYLTGMGVAALAGGIVMVYGLHWRSLWLNPLWFIFLEPVRGCILYYVARRY